MVRKALLLALSALAFSACTADVHSGPGPYDGPGYTLEWMFDAADVTTYDPGINESSFSISESRFDTTGCFVDSYDGYTRTEIEDDLALDNLRTGTLEQLLAYGSDYPAETLNEDIVALGSPRLGGRFQWAIYTRTSSVSADLGLTSGDFTTGFFGDESWLDGTLFLACPD